jgi:metallo-beta-lactamase family protein
MKISFFGAARTVTGTRHLVEANGLSILLDCGLSQGKREESFRLNRELPFDAGKIDLVVLSHAHIDHSGNLPRLVKSGFQGDIICTGPTRDLAAVMLRDSAHIQESDIEYLNKKRERDNLPPLEPLYTADDAEKTCRRFSGTDYGRTRDLAPGVTVTFHDAGHILGSAFVVLEFADPKGKNKPTRLVFSGDLGRKNRPIIRDPEPCDGADVLIIESTYGDRLHEHAGESEENLRSIIADAVKRGGKVIVPSFAVGRTQELVYSLHRLILEKKLPETLPVFVDSPLAVEATEVFRLHPEAWDAETGAFARGSGGPDPFGFARMKYTRTRDESMKLNDLKGPAVIISASGMAESGRILHHLKHHIGDERSTILFVPGRKHPRPPPERGHPQSENPWAGIWSEGPDRKDRWDERPRRQVRAPRLAHDLQAKAGAHLRGPRRGSGRTLLCRDPERQWLPGRGSAVPGRRAGDFLRHDRRDHWRHRRLQFRT